MRYGHDSTLGPTEKGYREENDRPSPSKNGLVERWRCLYCLHIYKIEKSAASCRCAGAEAARDNTGKSNFEAVMVDPMNAIGEPPAEPRAAEVAAQPEGEQAE